MTSPTKPLPFGSPRASPFRRPESPSPRSPSSTSPTKKLSLSPNLSPEKHNPFVRRPSQFGHAAERPSSPFARPSSRLSVVESPSRNISHSSQERLPSPSPSFAERRPSATPSFAGRRPSPTPSFAERLPSPTPSFAERLPSPTPSLEERVPSPKSSLSPPAVKTPKLGTPIHLDGPASPSFSPSPSFDHSPSPSPTRPSAYASAVRPVAHRTVTSSTAGTVRPFSLKPTASASKPLPQNTKFGLAAAGGNYNHIPQPLLRSMRESFEVLDSANSGTVNSANLAELLDQLGMDSSARALLDFFPPNAPTNLNLARYLDTLSAPYSDLSQPDELAAAFSAFDVDDSGQIDLAELKDALLTTAPDHGGEDLRMTEAEVDSVMATFSSRRAFGGKGVFGNAGGKSRGDVFRYRDFMASITGGAGDLPSDQVEVA